MITYNKGDIVLVPFPFSDQTFIKKRPAVVISSNDYNNYPFDITIMAVISNIEAYSKIGECLINNYKEAGLLKPSSIKPAISTINKSLILRKLGALSLKDFNLMEKILRELLGL
jgi:mRNA interferase MazF